jgi:hypothetical protein
MLGLVLLVFAFVLAVCAAANWPIVPRPHLGWAAFACFIAYLLFAHGPTVFGR